MAKNKASNARRREVRRNLSAGSRPLLERMRDRRVLWPVVFGLALVLIGGTVANLGHQRVPYEVGQVVDDPVVARVSFTTIDEEKTEEERHDARLRQPSIFKPHQDYLQGVREKLIGLAELATDAAIESIDQVPAETRESLKIDARTLRDLRQLVNNPDQPAWPQQVERFVTEGLASLPILSSSAKRVERNPRQRPSHIVLQHPSNREMVRYDHAILSPEDDQRAIQSALRSFLNNKVPSSVSESMVAAVTQNLQPTYIVNQELTEQRRAQRAEAVEPVKITYQPGEVVVSAGHALSRLDRQVIHEEQRAYWEALHPSVQIAKMASRYGLLALIAIALWSYLRSYADRVVTNPMRGLAITSLILLCQGLSVMGAITLPTTYLLPSIVLPTLLVAIVLTIAYDRRTALAVGIMHALVVVLSLNTTIGQELIVLTGVAVAVAQLKEVRTRSKLVLTGFNTGLAMGFAAAAVGVLAWPLLNVDANSPSALPTRDLQQIGISVGNMILTGIAA
ncbi:MAG: hypothetical protein R3336_04290, partial [Phycisphaeraceae bacterium]|nr:hypothetical protein [Phycisphaeraceae bacterium]